MVPGLFTVTVAGMFLTYNLTAIEPVYGGFFCDDQTLQYPYKPESVNDVLGLIISVLIPVVIVSTYIVYIHWQKMKK